MPYSLLNGIPFYTKDEIDNNFSGESIAKERVRAEAAEAVLQGNINAIDDEVDALLDDYTVTKELVEATADELVNETSRATSAERANASAIQAEATRATAAEQTNADVIQAETTRAVLAEGNLSNAIIRETTRATAAEQNLQDKIDAIDVIDISGLQQDIDNEVTRATAAEQANANAIQAETTRATAAEQNLSNAIIRETTRATDAETALQNSISSEQARAEGAESDLQDAIDAVDTKADANTTDIATLQTEVGANTTNIAGINAKIPAEASPQNQLADKAYVAEQIETNAATYRGSFATWADVPTDPNGYLPDSQDNKKPEPHDYIYVRNSSGYNVQNTGIWKFELSGDWDSVGKNGWSPVYSINSDVFSQAQMSAIDSGVTTAKVTNYDSHIASTQNPHNVTKAQVGLGNCDNTADINKPISAATQAALNAKQDTLTTGNGISIIGNVISADYAAIPITASGSTIEVVNGYKRYKLINDGSVSRSATVAAATALTDTSSEAFVIADTANTEKWVITYLDKTGLATKTIDVPAGEYVKFIWNVAGFICEHTIQLTGVDENNIDFQYDVIIRE